MKTFQKFNEDVNEFMKNTFMKNPTVKGIIDPLKDGNINMSDIKKKVTSKKGQEDLNDLKTKGLNTLIRVGQGYLDKASKKVNN
tara:strand:+ start:122 stop:373 length:252 start_codon:yes stop_codon:yes gene_type:complete